MFCHICGIIFQTQEGYLAHRECYPENDHRIRVQENTKNVKAKIAAGWKFGKSAPDTTATES